MNIEEKLDQLGHKKVILIAFLVGFVVRLIPEILSFPYPIGWDTIYYASRIEQGVVFSVGSDLVNSWLVYGILVALGNLTQADPFMILKVFAPLLYGGTCAGMYFVAWKRFNWSSTKSLLVAVLFSFQLAALTVSWQFYRNVFGVMVLLFALPLIRKDVSWKGLVALSVLSLFTVWGHELAMASLFFIVFGMLAMSVYRKEKIPYRLFVAILPAVLLFMGNFFWISPFAIPLNPNLVYFNDANFAHPGGLFFLTDYLNVNTPIEFYSSYFSLFFDVASLFVLLYALLLPLVAVGYFKDRVLSSWSFILLVGGVGCLVVPFAALFLWARWMILLIYPLSFFAANGLWKITKSLKGVTFSRFTGKFKLTKKVAAGLVLGSIIVGGLFMVFPLVEGKYGIIGWGGTFKYVPSTMQSSSVPLQDVQGVIEAYNWLNENMDSDSSLLVHDVFDMWTMLYLNQNYRGYLFDFDLEGAKNQALADGYDSVYFVWWNQDIGWYNLRVQNNWSSVQDYGRISVYKLA
ncbi:MAG: hypothetical protein QCH99_08300 [Candidatus Bathyarchaeota archaeon]|nr:hypothetical protein [Candidatus Bathyarchaeum tardum]